MYERTYRTTVLKSENDTKIAKRGSFPWKIILWIVAGMLFVAVVIVLIRLPKLQVANIDVQGVNVVDPKDVTTIIQDSLQGNKLYIFPRTSIVLLPERSLQKKIKAQYPWIKSVSIRRVGTSSIRVTVQEYVGVYLWCVDVQNCYFMDADGTVFTEAPYFSGSAYPRIFIGTQADLPFKPITTAQLAMVSTLTQRLRAITIQPAEFQFSTSPDVLTVIFYHNGAPVQLLINPDIAIDDSLEALFTAIHTDPLAGMYHDSAKILQFIDVSVPDKVVYKFQV